MTIFSLGRDFCCERLSVMERYPGYFCMLRVFFCQYMPARVSSVPANAVVDHPTNGTVNAYSFPATQARLSNRHPFTNLTLDQIHPLIKSVL